MFKPAVQTARDSPELNMEFCSFDNGFKQLRAAKSMQVYHDLPFLVKQQI